MEFKLKPSAYLFNVGNTYLNSSSLENKLNKCEYIKLKNSFPYNSSEGWSFWINNERLYQSGTILQCGTNTATKRIYVDAVDESYFTIGCELGILFGSGDIGLINIKQVTFDLSPKEWYHVFVYIKDIFGMLGSIDVGMSGSFFDDYLKMYINGTSSNLLVTDIDGIDGPDDTVTSVGYSLIGSGFNFVGSTGNTNPYYGYITEVSRWSGSITDDLVNTLYNSGTALDLRTFEENYLLTNYWKLSDGMTFSKKIQDRKIYDLVEGNYINGEYIRPNDIIALGKVGKRDIKMISTPSESELVDIYEQNYSNVFNKFVNQYVGQDSSISWIKNALNRRKKWGGIIINEPQFIQMENLIAYYSMDNNDGDYTILDDSTNGRDATIQGATYGDISDTGKNLSSVNCDAGSFRLLCDIESTFGEFFAINKPFTISMWIKSKDTTTGILFDTFGNGDTHTNGDGGFTIEKNASNALYFRIYYYTSGFGEQKTRYKYSFSWSTTGYDHVVVVYDGSGLIANSTLYVNGDSSNNITANENVLVTGATSKYSNASIGASRRSVSSIYSQYKGNIDEVAIWKVALTPTEVAELYNSGNGYFLE